MCLQIVIIFCTAPGPLKRGGPPSVAGCDPIWDPALTFDSLYAGLAVSVRRLPASPTRCDN